jgi:hypothetical protein
MMLILIAAASLALAEPTSAPAADSAKPSPPPAAKAEKPPKPKLVCTSERQIGSLMPTRVCRTPEQLEAERRAAERATSSPGVQHVCMPGDC